jgi:hypothetical protein
MDQTKTIARPIVFVWSFFISEKGDLIAASFLSQRYRVFAYIRKQWKTL